MGRKGPVALPWVRAPVGPQGVSGAVGGAPYLVPCSETSSSIASRRSLSALPSSSSTGTLIPEHLLGIALVVGVGPGETRRNLALCVEDAVSVRNTLLGLMDDAVPRVIEVFQRAVESNLAAGRLTLIIAVDEISEQLVSVVMELE